MIDLKDKPMIVGEKIVLRPFKVEEDFPFLEECLNDPVVIKYTGSSSKYDREAVIQWYETRNEQTDRLDLAIVDKLQQTLVGEAVVNGYDEENHSMNFRILIGPRGRDCGFGTEATQLMIDYIFTNTDLKQLTLSVFDFNPRGKRVYEKVGFVATSVDKDDLEYEGKWIDSINMCLTRENWVKMRQPKIENNK